MLAGRFAPKKRKWREALAPYNVMNAKFSQIYELYIKKAERKNRSKDEVDTIIKWLTGYTDKDISLFNKNEITLGEFLLNIPKLNSNANLIKGLICGIRVEEIDDPIVKKMRLLDKLIDELAKGKELSKILRKEKE